MDSLFSRADAELYPLVKYIQTFLQEHHSDFNLFQLPPIQRNAVWNAAQIERLWDSLLRGYPIGSFLVSPRQQNDKARGLYTGRQIPSKDNGYFLSDGQQRTRALLLGFKPTSTARLYIDLDPSLYFDNAEYNDRKFLLRVLTSHQPWGMSDRNPNEKLPEHQKFPARQDLQLERQELNNQTTPISLRYDYEVGVYTGDFTNDTKGIAWPIKASLPVPMDALIDICGGTTGVFKEPAWRDVCDLVSSRHKDRIPNNPTSHFNKVMASLRSILDLGSTSTRIRTIVFQYQNPNPEPSLNDEQDDMEVLFRRINAGGTVLQGEEMTYSLLKASWDGAYDMVSAIVNSKTIGYLLSPTSIVMAATRIVRYIQKENDIPNPGAANFRKWIGGKSLSNPFLQTMQSLLNLQDRGGAMMQQIMESFCNLVLYREQDTEDVGIPRKLLLSIHVMLFHPVFIWLYSRQGNSKLIEENRLPVLRYLMYCYLAVDKYDQASKIAVNVIKNHIGEGFPDKEIYEALLDGELTVLIPSPEELSMPWTSTKANGLFRTWHQLFDIPNDHYNSFRQWFWESSRELLLWYQRQYSTRWFLGYNPTSDDAYDTPYDWDHILPYSHLIGQGNYAFPSCDPNQEKEIWEARYRYINSIGNLRLWPLWCNRGDSNACHTYKLRMEAPNWNDPNLTELQLFSVREFLQASLINTLDEDLWYESGGTVRNWPEKRRIAWQTAVENRVSYLYREFFNAFSFEYWKSVYAPVTSSL